VDPSEFLRIGNKFIYLQRYKDCFFTKKIKNKFFLKIILIKHLDKFMFFKNKVKMLIKSLQKCQNSQWWRVYLNPLKLTFFKKILTGCSEYIARSMLKKIGPKCWFKHLKNSQTVGSNENSNLLFRVHLKGQCHEIFCFWFFSLISFPPAQEYCI
jgi:hypothetical protein